MTAQASTQRRHRRRDGGLAHKRVRCFLWNLWAAGANTGFNTFRLTPANALHVRAAQAVPT